MPYLIILLALACGVAGVAILLIEKRQRSAQLGGVPTPNIPAIETAEPEAPENHQTATPAPVAAPHPEPEPAPAANIEPELAAEPVAESAPEPTPESGGGRSHATRARSFVPGSMRRGRRAWGEEHGFEYTKQDDYLADEWMRGAAALGAAPKDIVAGFVHGHEMLMIDLGGINVMAMRTGATSDIVVDFRRVGIEEDSASEDLFMVDEIEGFEVFATDVGVGKRLIDERLEVALHLLPAEVTAVWMESEWVLAQTTKHARAAEWDAMLAPMAKLADVARVLPPRSSAAQVLRVEELDPSREIPAPPQAEPTGPTLVPDHEEIQRPHIQRPEEPVELPSRTRSEVRGVVDHSALGADEVDAIADGRERPLPDKAQARMRRNLNRRSTIFGDEDSNE